VCSHVCNVASVERLRTCGESSGNVAVSWHGGWDASGSGYSLGGYRVELVQDSDANYGGRVSMFHVHQGASSSMQIIEMHLRDAARSYSVVVTPCWMASSAMRCFSEFSAASAQQRAVRSSSDSSWAIRLSPSASTVNSHIFSFDCRCTSPQFQASFTLMPLSLVKTPQPLSTQMSILSSHISNVISVFSSIGSLPSFLAISCISFSDVGFVCGCSVPVPEASRSNSSVASLRGALGPSLAIVIPQSDNSLIFFGIICGNESGVNLSVAVVRLPFDNTLLMLRLNSKSASIQLPFAVPSNFSSGRVSFATSTSLTGDFAADFVRSSLHCVDSSTTAAAVASVASGVRPVLQQKQTEGAIFAFETSLPILTTDICWSEARLLDTISGLTIGVDGSWSLLDVAVSFDPNCVVLQAPGVDPVQMTRDASVAVVAVVGSTVIITASCDAPLTVTWVISKHFDLELSNSSSGQNARFDPLPHHGGGKFRV
jgi:hypothetical protein